MASWREDEDKWYEFVRCCKYGWIEEGLKYLKEVKPEETNKPMNNGMDDGQCPPLWFAARRGDVELIEALLKRPEIEIEKVTTGRNRTPLMAACDTSKVDASLLLIKEGANALYHSPVTKNKQLGISVLDCALHNTYHPRMHLVVIEILKKHPQRKYVAENGLKTRDIEKSGPKCGVQYPDPQKRPDDFVHRYPLKDP